VAAGTNSPALRFTAIASRVQVGEQGDDDLEALLELGGARSGLSYDRRNRMTEVLIKGWSHSDKLKERLLKVLQPFMAPDHRQLDRRLAEQTLLGAFPADPDANAWAAQQIRRERFPFIALGPWPSAWQLLRVGFGTQLEVVSAIDEWLLR